MLWWICPTHMWHFVVLDRYQVQRLFGTALILAYFAESWRNRTHVIGLCWQSLSLQDLLADRLKSSMFIIVFLATFKIFLHTLWKNSRVAPSAATELLFGMLASRKAENTTAEMRVKWSIHVLVKCITASPFSVAAAHLKLNELVWFVGRKWRLCRCRNDLRFSSAV